MVSGGGGKKRCPLEGPEIDWLNRGYEWLYANPHHPKYRTFEATWKKRLKSYEESCDPHGAMRSFADPRWREKKEQFERDRERIAAGDMEPWLARRETWLDPS